MAALLRWALPIFTLALIPKCPACVAAYVLLLTGIGMSFHAAAAVRWTLIVLSVAALCSFSICELRRSLARRS